MVVESTKQIAGYEKTKTVIQIKHPGRVKLSDKLRREKIVLQPEEDVIGLKPVGEEITEVLEYKSAELYVKQYIRPEYIKPTDDKLNAKRVIAELPSMFMEKSYCGNSLLTHLTVNKYVDHMPIHRLLLQLKRLGVELDYTTVINWLQRGFEKLTPLYEAHKARLLQSDYLCVDETTIKVLDKNKKGTTHLGYYWVYYDPVRKLVMFDYREGRSGEFPKEMLKGFKGYLQTDGYGGYDQFDKRSGVRTLNCWAHVRRKFFDAKDYDKEKAEDILTQIQQLYQIESDCREHHFSPAEIKAHRQEHAIPILSTLHETLNKYLQTTLPSSPMGTALQYTLNRWSKLCVYTEDGKLQIDNNLVENSIRPVAIGRKNYLFAGSHEAARRAGMMYSFFATCKLHNINPEQWLTNVFDNINDTHINKIVGLVPQNYQSSIVL